MNIGQFGNGIRKYFNAHPSKFMWRDGLIFFGRIMIDMFYLEEFVSKNKDYNEDESLQENITRIYGKDAANFIEQCV